MEYIQSSASEVLPNELTWREQEVLELLAERLTNREIAQQLHLAVSTVKEYVGYILAKLYVKNRRQAVEHALTLGLIGLEGKRTAKSSNNLPSPLTSFVGRENELKKIATWISDQSSRLLTLTGPPGTGKTRLALQAATSLNDEFNHGVYFVSLATVCDPEFVSMAIANTLGIQEVAGQSLQTRLKNYLHEKHMLLLLDNFEQVIQAASFVVDLLAAAPGVKMMVTSREGLRVSGEQELLVPALALPDGDERGKPFAALEKYEAVKLFIQRIRSVKSDFVLTEVNAPIVVQICRQLDGLPLAIELAAPHLRLFSLEGLHERLKCRFDLLKDGMRDMPERHQTLRATIDWSYDLLEPGEQLLLARMSVFQGERTIEAIEAVCCPDLPIGVVDGLQALLNKSLIRQIEGPERKPRFVLLETIHDYAQEQLDKIGETSEIRTRHAAYFTNLVEQAEPHTRAGADQMIWLRRLEVDIDDLRAALKWSLGDGEEKELGLRLVGALGHFWFRQGHNTEGQEWTVKALEEIGDAPISVRAALHRTKTLLLAHTTNHIIRFENIQEAFSLYKELGDRREMGWALTLLGLNTGVHLGEIDEAFAQVEEGLALLWEVNDRPGIALSLNILGELVHLRGDLESAEAVYLEALVIAREIGDKLREAILVLNLGEIAYLRGQLEEALTLFQQAMALGLELEHKSYIASTLALMSGPFDAVGQPERAARLIGAADAINDTMGIEHPPTVARGLERMEINIRQQIDEVTFKSAWREGRAMSYHEAIALALDTPDSN